MILVSPSLEILLLHRVQTSSSFPSAHVFPGGNIDTQDGYIPEDGVERHQDNQAYRVGALRELFEESGILLARQNLGSRQLVSLPQSTREEGRKLVHSGKMPFQGWLNQQSPTAVLDTDALIPFSHWITPPNIPRRFTTQMYLYVLPSEDSKPLPADSEATLLTAQPEDKPASLLSLKQTEDFTPTPDNDLENTSTTFLPATIWLEQAQLGSIILFPPQFLLLHLISQFLDTTTTTTNLSPQQRTQQLKEFVYRKREKGDGTPSWAEKCISPYALPTQTAREDGKTVLGLEKAGVELEELGVGLRGDGERVVLVKWSKEGPREVEVRFRREMLEEGRREVKL